jgi:glucose uptake protein GlcU
MIVVLCWSHRIACERDNDVLLFHTRISVLAMQCGVTAMVLLLAGIRRRRTQQQAEMNVMLNYNNCVVVVKGSQPEVLALILISV